MAEFSPEEIDEVRRQAANNPISFEDLLSRHQVVGVGEHHFDRTIRRKLLAEMEKLHRLGLLDEIVIEVEDSSLERARDAGPLTPAESRDAIGLRSDYLDLIAAAKRLGIPVSGGDSSAPDRKALVNRVFKRRAVTAAEQIFMVESCNDAMANHVRAASRDGRHVVYFAGLDHQVHNPQWPHVRTIGEQLRDAGIDATDALHVGGIDSPDHVRGPTYPVKRLSLAFAAGVEDRPFAARVGNTTFFHVPVEGVTDRQIRLMRGDYATASSLGHPSNIVRAFTKLVTNRPHIGWSALGDALAANGLREGAIAAHKFGAEAGDDAQLLDVSRLMSFDENDIEAAKYVREAVLRAVPGAALLAENLHDAIGDSTNAELLRRCRQNDPAAIDELRRLQDTDPIDRRLPGDTKAQLDVVSEAVERKFDTLDKVRQRVEASRRPRDVEKPGGSTGPLVVRRTVRRQVGRLTNTGQTVQPSPPPSLLASKSSSNEDPTVEPGPDKLLPEVPLSQHDDPSSNRTTDDGHHLGI